MTPSLLLMTALATPAPGTRDAHTLEIAGGLLPSCAPEARADDCKLLASVRAHGDHRLQREFLIAWDLIGQHRGYRRGRDRVMETYRADISLALGWHREWSWGDLRLYAGPSLEYARWNAGLVGGLSLGLDWLDPGSPDVGQVPGWLDVGAVLGNDLDWPVGDVRIGFRWRIRVGADVLALQGGRLQGPAPEVLGGVDWWELHAASIAWPWVGPIGVYAEVGWVNQFTIPTQQPQFRITPWLTVGVQVRAGTVRPAAGR